MNLIIIVILILLIIISVIFSINVCFKYRKTLKFIENITSDFKIIYWNYDYENDAIIYSTLKNSKKIVIDKEKFLKCIKKDDIEKIEEIFKGKKSEIKIKADFFQNGDKDYKVYCIIKNENKEKIIKGIIIDLQGIKKDDEILMGDKIYENIFQNIPLGAAVLDENRNIIKINSEFLNMLGYKKDEILEKNITYISNKEDEEKNEKLREIIDFNHKKEMRKRYYKKNGDILEAKLFFGKFEIKEFEKKYFVGIVEDLTEKIKQEKELEKFKMIVEQSPVSIIITDIDANIEYVNQNMCNLTGYKKEELIGKKPSILKTNYTSQKEYEILWDTILSGNVWRGEFKNKQKDGTEFWERAYISGIKDENGRINGFIGIKEDITFKKEIGFALQKSESRFRAVVQDIPFILFRYNQNGEILFKNNKFYDKIVGSEKNIELNIKNIFDGDLLNRLEDDNIKEFEVERKTYRDETVYEKWIKRRIETELLNEVQIIVIDVTKDKKIEKYLYKAKQRAESADKAKSAFIANMSHEIRTPLNGIIGFASILMDEEKDASKLEMIELITKSGENLLGIINDILDLAKIESGKAELNLESVNLNDVFHNINILMKNIVENHKLIFSFEKDDFNKPVKCDVIKLNQIFNNLVSNAVKFTDKGEIKINIKKINEEKHGIFLEISVKDTGIGIAKENLETIFESFRQLENVYIKKYKGTGLGLSIVKKLVILMNGRIDVKSEEGVGSEFIVQLPFEYSEKSPIKRIVDIGNKVLEAEKKVLIVEDNPVNRKLIETLVKKTGLKYESVEDGKSAVEKAINEEYAFILMDIQLPEIDGFEATKLIREKEKRKNTIIAVTAYAMSRDKEKCIEMGMDDYIPKPIQKEEFYSIIGKYIEKE